MTTTDFLIHDTGTGQQLAVSDIHAALAEPDGYVLPPVAVDPDLPLPVAEHMDRRAHERWGMGVDAWLAETRDWMAEQARRTDLPPPAQPEPQWAELDEPETPARPVGGHVYDDATGWVPQVPDGAATRAALTVQARRAGITADDPEPAPPARSRLRDVLRRAWRRIDEDVFGPAEQHKETTP